MALLFLCHSRFGHSGTLTINNNVDPPTAVANQDSAYALSGITDLYFGSYPLTDYANLQQGGFFGCIKNAKIHPDSIDHSVISSDQVNLVNVELECEPPRPPIQGTVSFNEATPGFVRLPPIQTNGSLSLSFMFRTTATHGLIAYLEESQMGYYISLSMLDGALHLYAHPDIQIVTRNPENQEVRNTFPENKNDIILFSRSSSMTTSGMWHPSLCCKSPSR